MVTTVYVIATTSFSGILAPRMFPALIPIGFLSGLSAVVCLLLIVAVAGNKIQGLAMVRALGMLIAGLPCLPWFIDSAWNLAFGVLPPYWAAKAFWVASDHGNWWPYSLAVSSTTWSPAGCYSAASWRRTRERIGLVEKAADEFVEGPDKQGRHQAISRQARLGSA